MRGVLMLWLGMRVRRSVLFRVLGGRRKKMNNITEFTKFFLLFTKLSYLSAWGNLINSGLKVGKAGKLAMIYYNYIEKKRCF